MSRRVGFWILGIGILGALVVWLWLRGGKPPVRQNETLVPQTEVSPPTAKVQEQAGPLASRLEQTLGALRSGADANKGRLELAELRKVLATGGTNSASAAIRKFLDSKSDAGTGRAFKVGGHGFLDEAPTLRTFLLDQLGQLDPAAAAAYARVILNSSESPDEWAVALRSLALGDNSADGRALLAQKTAELLRREEWQREPSAGYLEAFDAAVYLGGTNLVPALGDLVRKRDNQAVAHAAYLALDRLVINDPANLLRALETDPATMQGRELTRANYFARADVRDANQRQVLETYLLDPRIGPTELAQFAGLYPSANFMVSPNLLTPAPAPDPAGLRARDAESLRLVQEWLADPRFAALRPQLEKVKERLEEFARQAAGK
jgi:hypothetical protein